MENNKNSEKPWWRDGVILFTKVSAYIAIPIIVALYASKFLAQKYGNGTYIFFVSIGIAFLSTIFLIGREVQIYRKQIEKEEKNK